MIILKKKIFYIINMFKDEKIKNYKNEYLQKLKNEIKYLLVESSSYKKKINIQNKKKIKYVKVKSNTSKSKFLSMVDKAKNYIKIGDIFQVVLSQRFEAKLSKKPLEIYKKLGEQLILHLLCIFLILQIFKSLEQVLKF